MKNNFIDDTSINSRIVLKSNISNFERINKIESFSCCEKLTRSFCLRNRTVKGKLNLLNNVVKISNKKISIENIGKLSKEVKLLKCILLDEDQRNILKYVNLGENSKINKKIEDSVAIMKNRSGNNNHINDRLMNYLECK